MRPRLLDLFCGAGGAAVGYHRAGFDVVGVDIAPQPHYPFEFYHADALAMERDRLIRCWHEGVKTSLPGRLRACLGHFDAIHASPPCQGYTTGNARYKGQGGIADNHPRLIPPTRELLIASGLPYVMENVEGAASEMATTLRLTGKMFGLKVWRPRLFESNVLMLAPEGGRPTGLVIGVYGNRPDGRYLNSRTKKSTGNRAAKGLAEAQDAMGMDWADWHGTKEAIPPAYTEFIGAQLLAAIEVKA